MTNTLEGLDLIQRVTELWTEVCNIVQMLMKIIPPKKNKCKKAKWFSKEVFQKLRKAEKGKEVKVKGGKEKYTHLNAEFQISRGDKKNLSEQSKEIEENNKIGKTREHFNKIRNTKGTCHAKIGTIKLKSYGPNRSRRY